MDDENGINGGLNGGLKDVLSRLENYSDKIPSEIRLSVTKRAAQNFSGRKLSQDDMDVALSMFRIMCRDVEVEIRQVLAESLKSDPMLPRDIALVMAKDVIDVSSPLLQFSPVLEDKDLLEILKDNPPVAKQLAIATRPVVNEPVVMALVENGPQDVLARVIENQGAKLNDQSVLKAFERFPEAESSLIRMVERHALPREVMDRLVSKVSLKLRGALMETSGGSAAPSRVDDAIMATEEWARLTLVAKASQKEMESYVDELNRTQKLTPSLMLRALCWGYVNFFEAAIASRANVPLNNARQLLHDQGPLGFKAIYKAANMPAGMGEAMKVLFHMALDAIKNHEENARFPEALLEGIMRGGYQGKVDNMAYIVALLGHNIRIGMQS
ncbi:DUF2336 domain-containing protein [bacterium]|nr:DUF2336 domain-containing protein [bacterium]